MIQIGENRGIWATSAHAMSLQATANSPRSGSKEGAMAPGRPGRPSLRLFQNTARLKVLCTSGQMPRADRDRRGQAGGISGVTRGFGRRARLAGSCGVAMAPGLRPINFNAGWSSPEARQAHNLEVGRSNRSPATTSDREMLTTSVTENPASPTRKRLEKRTVDCFGGTGVRTPASRPGSGFETARIAMSENDWPILDPAKLKIAFDSMPSVGEFEAAEPSRQDEIVALWHDRLANGDEFEMKAADTRLWWVDCVDRHEHDLARADFLDVVTEDRTR